MMQPARSPADLSAHASAPSAERVSAWVDGELDAGAVDVLYAELKRDEALRRAWLAHHVVGDALRSSEVAGCQSSDLCARIGAALADEPALLVPQGRPRRLVQRWVAPVAGVAAATAFLAIGVPHVLTPDVAVTRSPQSVAGAALAPVAAAAPRVVTLREIERDPRLEAYLRAHREMDDAGVMPRAAHYLRAEDGR
jgi:negative regulator of sigma E activity